MLSSVTADAIGRAAFGSHPFLTLPAFTFSSPLEYLLYAGLGVLAARRRPRVHPRALRRRRPADRLWRGPDWLRPAAGGLLLGLLLLAVPEMYGVGYPVLESSRRGPLRDPGRCSACSSAKILATSLTIWIGGSGGVFAPSLFMGAMLGTAYGAVAHDLCPRLAPPRAPTGWSGWAPSSPPPRARRSPRCSSSSS